MNDSVFFCLGGFLTLFGSDETTQFWGLQCEELGRQQEYSTHLYLYSRVYSFHCSLASWVRN